MPALPPMPKVAYINGTRVSLAPSAILGQGGEAVVYRVDAGGVTYALKIFKTAGHPDYNGLPHEQKMAEARVVEHQTKLPAFPTGMPSNVIAPKVLAYNKDGTRLLGYGMDLIPSSEVIHRYVERDYQESFDFNDIVAVLQHLHETVLGIHGAKVVIGDFNDLNILVAGKQTYVIDADSMQYATFFCKLFTERFVDPVNCDLEADPGDPAKKRLMLKRPHTPDSDWYSFAIMVMQSLLRVGPYSGVFKPKKQRAKASLVERPKLGISVFDPDVKYPRVALPLERLPDDLLHHFQLMFEKEKRGEFPRALLDMRWSECSACNTLHARHQCPECAHMAPGAVKETVTKRGTVTATVIFRTRGAIVYAATQNRHLRYVYIEEAKLKRDGGSVVCPMPRPDPKMRFRIQDGTTLIGKGSTLVVSEGGQTEKFAVDRFHNLPVFDANARHTYRIEAGVLRRSGNLQAGEGEVSIGDVLQGQTLFWAGDDFGFGFYRVGEGGTISFVFDTERPRSLNDSVDVSAIRGQLVDATCTFGRYAWFFTTTSLGGQVANTCHVIGSDGKVRATHTAPAGDPSWLGSIRGKCSVGAKLLVSTDEGIVMVGVDNGQLTEEKNFPDTQPFVDSAAHLLPGREGIYVVGRKEITLLKMG